MAGGAARRLSGPRLLACVRHWELSALICHISVNLDQILVGVLEILACRGGGDKMRDGRESGQATHEIRICLVGPCLVPKSEKISVL